MKRLRYDIIEGFDKGVIDAYENDNNTEIYKISLLKDKFRNIYDLTDKSIKMCLMNPNDKSGTIINIGIEDRVKGLIQLPIKSEITLKDGTYLCQFTIAGTNFKQTTKIFTINIKNNLFNDLAGVIEDDERFPILEDALNRLEILEVELEPMIDTLEIKLPELQNALDDIAGYLDFTSEIKKARRNHPDIDTRITNDIDGVNENLEKFSYIPYESQNIQAKNTFNGYTKEMIIKGKTLQNLSTPANESWSNAKSYGYLFLNVLMKTNTTYSLVILGVSDNISNVSFGGGQSNERYFSSGKLPIIVFNSGDRIFDENIIRVYPESGKELIESDFINTNVMLLEGDYSNKGIPPYFEGIKSAGELEENEIIYLSNNSGNLISENNIENGALTWEKGELINDDNKIRTKEFIKVSSGLTVYSDIPCALFQYDKNKKYLGRAINNYILNTSPEKTKPECRFVKVVFDGNDIGYVGYDINKKNEPYKEDKKEISLPFEGGLKSLPNGVSDEIKNSTIQKVTKLKLDDTIDWQINDTSKEKTIRVIWNKLTPKPITKKDNTNLLCDKFPVKYNYNSDEEGLFINSTGELYNSIYLRINKARLKTPDINGFKEWIRNNNLVIQYELLNYNFYEFDVNINLQTFKYVTYISSENEIKPNISCKVLSNIPSVISELNEENAKLRQNESILKDGQITLANTLIGALEAVTLSLDDFEKTKENEQIIALQELILKLQNMR